MTDFFLHAYRSFYSSIPRRPPHQPEPVTRIVVARAPSTAPLSMDEEDARNLSPRHPRHSGSFVEHAGPRSISPTMRAHPKAVRSLLMEGGDSEEPLHFDRSAGFGRGSPNPFQPIRAAAGEDDATSFSMAGLTNVQELRNAAMMSAAYDPEPMIKACVKVFVTQVLPSYGMPWTRGDEARSTGSGFVVRLPAPWDPATEHAAAAPAASQLGDGERGRATSDPPLHPNAREAAEGARVIVTNAHVVEHSSLIQVRCAGHAEKYVARVLCIGHDVDLAMLLVDDEAFWEGLPLVSLGVLIPRLASEVIRHSAACARGHAQKPRRRARTVPAAGRPRTSPLPTHRHRRLPPRLPR